MAEASTSVPPGACPTEPPATDSPPLFQSGVLTFQAHHVGWIVSSFFAIVATAVSIWLIVKHLTWYTKPKQQRQIVRLLLMVPIYAVISCMAYFFWNHAVPLALIRDAYEGIILASFFYLLLQYLAPTPAEQKEYFRTYKLEKWAWPFGWVKRKPDGLYFLQLMKWSILQYCWVRPLTSFAAVVLNMAGLYCEISWSPRFGSVWILIIVSISVSVAMFCLIQFYLAISDKIKKHKPLLQLFSIKAIIFLMFWQSSFLSALHSMDVIKDTKYMTAIDINVGFAALLQTFEMVLFAFLHVRCFSYIPYRRPLRSEQTPKGASLRNALNFSDFWRETRDGSVYMWRTARGKEAEFEARRRTHFERAMGKSRTLAVGIKKDLPPAPHPDGDEESDGDDDFLVANPRLLVDTKERRSLEKGAEKRPKTDGIGYATKSVLLPMHADEEMALPPEQVARGQRSWLSRVYGRLSGDDQITEDNTGRGSGGTKHTSNGPIDIALPLASNGKGRIQTHARRPVDLDEPPPPSLLGRRQRSGHAGLPSEKLPFLDWDPASTQPPRIPGETIRLSEKLHGDDLTARQTAQVEEKMDLHRRDDSLLGRIFARSSEHSHHETEPDKPALKLPSLFLRKQDIAGAVKGWDLFGSKSLPAEPVQPQPSSIPVPVVATIEPADIPSIPSPSPSPPRVIPPSNNKATPPIPSAPAQPTPVLHPTLSYARRPSLLIADEAGTLPPLEPKPTRVQPEERTQSWVMATHKHIKPTAGNERVNPLSPPQSNRANDGRPKGTEGPPLSGSMRHRGYYPTRGPRKPSKVIMPTPLSPARYPGGEGAIAQSNPIRHALPPGAGYGPPPQPVHIPMPVNPYVYEDPPMPSHVEPYQMYTQNWARPAPVVQPAERYSRLPQREQNPHQQQQQQQRSNKRSPSPFGIQAASSDAESLPRHPGVRQQTARRRRESQPLPAVPSKRIESSAAPAQARASRRRSEPLQSSYNADMSSSPSLSAANLLNSSNPTSPLSAHGDSRYPRPTNYFDASNSTNPYFTTLMNDAIAPVIVVPSLPTSPVSPSHRLKRR